MTMKRLVSDLASEERRARQARNHTYFALLKGGTVYNKIERDPLYIEASANAERAKTRLWRARRGLDR